MKFVQSKLQKNNHNRNKKAKGIHAAANGHANGGCGPNTGRRGEAAYGALIAENNAGAQKTDAADNLGGNAGGIGAAGRPENSHLQRISQQSNT